MNSNEIDVNMKIYATVSLIEMGATDNWWEGGTLHNDTPAIIIRRNDDDEIPMLVDRNGILS
jgi:hypothetical protein